MAWWMRRWGVRACTAVPVPVPVGIVPGVSVSVSVSVRWACGGEKRPDKEIVVWGLGRSTRKGTQGSKGDEMNP